MDTLFDLTTKSWTNVSKRYLIKLNGVGELRSASFIERRSCQTCIGQRLKRGAHSESVIRVSCPNSMGMVPLIEFLCSQLQHARADSPYEWMQCGARSQHSERGAEAE
eukprot:2403834-Pleurochrysis_carterae.AAC.1